MLFRSAAPAPTARRARWGPRLVIGLPFAWLALLFLLPFVVVLNISLSQMNESGIGFKDLVDTQDGLLVISLRYGNYLFLLSDKLYLMTYLSSLMYAAVATVLCLLVGYPFAYFLARSPATVRPGLMMLVMLPFWTSFLLRVYAWKGLLTEQGLINHALIAIGLIHEPVQLLYNDVSMLVGMTYVYLPFMVLPLYANLVKLDTRLLEASQDLGATPWQTFWLVTVPLSRSGVVAGSMLVFIPCLGEFVIPSLLGGAENLMIGRVVWDEMFSSNNWPRACALAIVMIVGVVMPLAWYNQRVTRKAEEMHS